MEHEVLRWLGCWYGRCRAVTFLPWNNRFWYIIEICSLVCWYGWCWASYLLAMQEQILIHYWNIFTGYRMILPLGLYRMIFMDLLHIVGGSCKILSWFWWTTVETFPFWKSKWSRNLQVSVISNTKFQASLATLRSN